MQIIFATHNQNKVIELRRIVPKSIKIWSLNDINYHDTIEETGKTLEENAKIKSDFIRSRVASSGKILILSINTILVDAG